MGDYFDPSEYPNATITLTSLNGTFQTKKVAIPDGKTAILGRLAQENQDSPTVPKFVSKVVSRQHAIISHINGKWFIKDAGSSSGTFLQNPRFGDHPYRLSEQGKESVPQELHDGDIIQLGEDYDHGGVFHKCIQMKLLLPVSGALSSAMYSASPQESESYEASSSFVDYSTDPSVRREVEEEFNQIWASLRTPLENFAPRPSGSFLRKTSSEVPERRTSEPSSSGTLGGSRAPGPALVPSSPSPASPPASSVDGVDPQECITFIRSLTWESPVIPQRLLELVSSGDASILGFYRSLKQFPSAFKDVVTKYVQKKNLT